MSELNNAVENNNIEKVKILLRYGYDPSENDNYAIGRASQNGHIEIVKLLLDDPRVDPSENYNYAIGQASQNGHIEIVKLLLNDSRVNPSDYDNFSVLWASHYGNTEIVKLLINDSRVNPSASENAAIRLAANGGYTEVVKLLLSDPRVDPSAIDIKNAGFYCHFQTIKLLSTDPRVDWRIINEDMKNKLIKNFEIELKDELKASLLTINRVTPKMKIKQGSERQTYKSLIPKSVRKNIIYRAVYEELSLIKGEIPPIKLIALSNLLKIQYNANINWKELCEKVKINLLEML